MTPAGGARVDGDLATVLLGWYDRHRRDLPWRRHPTAYKTLVSEFMLQQTGVATVVPHFLRFMARFPDLRALAGAAETEVTGAWSGLGYYARARNLHRAARAVVQLHAGILPSDEAVLRTLPGIGPYTAAAIAAIAFARPAFALDGNAVRVVARLVGETEPTDAPAVRARLRAVGSSWVPSQRAGDFAQSVMELGATICRPRRPTCATCPLSQRCVAAAGLRPEELPRKRPRPVKQSVQWVALRMESRGFVAVGLRRSGLLAGTWMPPTAALAPRPKAAPKSAPTAAPAPSTDPRAAAVRRMAKTPTAARAASAAERMLASSLARSLARDADGRPRFVGHVDHVFTHRHLTVALFELALPRRAALPAADGPWCWIRRAGTPPSGLALSSLTGKLLRLGRGPA